MERAPDMRRSWNILFAQKMRSERAQNEAKRGRTAGDMKGVPTWVCCPKE
ncbi:hypothetical protein TRAPUB_4255 [Trametes pubescens]|uniref:Uncharacterized protein n=1 Tax=Trametes pubescens TaxID=154538 RepID=A0A1M2VBI1_TRAPU|nr:hypothetical protein TRAPUB_4255 [Trametes pubescens]